MIKKCNTEIELNRILEYLGTDYKESLYLFLDAKKYGIKNKNVKCWIQYLQHDTISSVILMYHTGMHIFSRMKKDFCVNEIVSLIKNEDPSIICAEESIINRLSSVLKEYNVEYGFVAQCKKVEKTSTINNIRLAQPKDYEQMAKMLMSDDDIGASYTLDDMISQIKERIEDGFSRSYCLFDNDRLIAQASTGAEEFGIATIAYVMTDPNYRGQGIAKSILSYMTKELTIEGFEIYLIYYSEEAGHLYLKHGFENVCKYGKLYKML